MFRAGAHQSSRRLALLPSATALHVRFSTPHTGAAKIVPYSYSIVACCVLPQLYMHSGPAPTGPADTSRCCLLRSSTYICFSTQQSRQNLAICIVSRLLPSAAATARHVWFSAHRSRQQSPYVKLLLPTAYQGLVSAPTGALM